MKPIPKNTHKYFKRIYPHPAAVVASQSTITPGKGYSPHASGKHASELTNTLFQSSNTVVTYKHDKQKATHINPASGCVY